MREPLGNDTAYWSLGRSGTAGRGRRASRESSSGAPGNCCSTPRTPPVTLDRAQLDRAQVADELAAGARLPLPCGRAIASPPGSPRRLQDLYGYRLGETIDSAARHGRIRRFTIAGVWRDYARASGAVVISRTAYIERHRRSQRQRRRPCGSTGAPHRPPPRPHCAHCFARGGFARNPDQHGAARTLAADIRPGLRRSPMRSRRSPSSSASSA